MRPYIKRTITITPTASELANGFCSLDDGSMAEFFNRVADTVSSWSHPFVFQLQALTDHPDLSPEARDVLAALGAYAEAT